MIEPRVPLYERLPEIYRIRDQEQDPPGQLRAYLSLVEQALGEVKANIDGLYQDLFIDTCADWVIPYIGDLLGVSPIDGDPWTLRADVADTIALRRRKGTLAGIERLVRDLTRWGVHCRELREGLAWIQHLNHQRPDIGGDPPYGAPSVTRFTPVRGGTLGLRDPAMLSLLGGPFDPFAHLADTKPPAGDALRYNLPNLAVFLWRLADYCIRETPPGSCELQATETLAELPGGGGPVQVHAVRVQVDALGRPLRLFNRFQYDPDARPPVVSELDRTPGPILMARLDQQSEAGVPEAYLAIRTYDPDASLEPGAVAEGAMAEVGLQLHLPLDPFAGYTWPAGEQGPEFWTIHGSDLSLWETCMVPPLGLGDLHLDPVRGRILMGVTQTQALALQQWLRLSYCYGAPGPVGAHPVAREPIPEPWRLENGSPMDPVPVGGRGSTTTGLQEALNGVSLTDGPLFLEIRDSGVHDLDLAAGELFDSVHLADGTPSLSLRHPLMIRAADGERPTIRLRRPLRFRPRDASDAAGLRVRLEGLFLTRDDDFGDAELDPDPDAPLIARAALDRLEIVGCTLDPGGFLQSDGTRVPVRDALLLGRSYGFTDAVEANAFDQTPELSIRRSILGPLRIDRPYRLSLGESILDAGLPAGTEEPAPYGPGDAFVLCAADERIEGWGPPAELEAVTCFGPMRIARIEAGGVIWTRPLEVEDQQAGCIKHSCLHGSGDRVPRLHACVSAEQVHLRFSNQVFGASAYGQLSRRCDFRIRERGPGDDAMGAYGFLREAHKWRNLQIRFREFLPVGTRVLPIPVT